MRLDLEKLEYIDSTGLGVMIGILKKLKIENKELYIQKPTLFAIPEVVSLIILTYSGFDEISILIVS